jgi:hypothetical protein
VRRSWFITSGIKLKRDHYVDCQCTELFIELVFTNCYRLTSAICILLGFHSYISSAIIYAILVVHLTEYARNAHILWITLWNTRVRVQCKRFISEKSKMNEYYQTEGLIPGIWIYVYGVLSFVEHCRELDIPLSSGSGSWFRGG